MKTMSRMGMDRQHQPAASGDRARVVVGVDGSDDSIAALRAGAWAAALRRATLTAVTAWAAPLVYGQALAIVPDLQTAAEETLGQALEDAFHGTPIIPVESIVRAGTPAGVLVDESRGAELLVVGSRGHGGFAGLLLGSVSMACTVHAHCPVLVMHGGDALTDAQEARSGARVVVGVGGGPASAEILRVAAQAAQELDAELLAIAAWSYPGSIPDPFADLQHELREAANRNLERQVAAAFPEGLPGNVRTELREGPAAAVLVDASRTADLLVVGRLGRSEFAGVLLGSVSMPVAAHAQCPVLVVPGAPTAASGAQHAETAVSAG
jgi:nucleotide-binding universal stress UspA family protein